MNKKIKNLTGLNNSFIKLLLGIFLLGLPLLFSVEAKANMDENMPQREMKTEPTNDPGAGYNSIDDGYDGEPVMTIPSMEETINVVIENKTNVAIDYQAIGFTENQTIEGGEEYTLRGLPVPVVIRAARQDDGFISSEPMINEDGVLKIAFDETKERNLAVVRIEEDGEVYINSNSSNSDNVEMSE